MFTLMRIFFSKALACWGDYVPALNCGSTALSTQELICFQCHADTQEESQQQQHFLCVLSIPPQDLLNKLICCYMLILARTTFFSIFSKFQQSFSNMCSFTLHNLCFSEQIIYFLFELISDALFIVVRTILLGYHVDKSTIMLISLNDSSLIFSFAHLSFRSSTTHRVKVSQPSKLMFLKTFELFYLFVFL